MLSRGQYRVVFVAVAVVSVALLANGYTPYGATTLGSADAAMDRPPEAREALAPPADGVTVVAARGFEGHSDSAALLAFRSDGKPVYFDSSLSTYWDVEPGADDGETVVYVGRTTVDGRPASVLEWVDLTTGEVERLAESVGAGWRTVDRINDTHLLVGNATEGRTFVFDVGNRTATWEWTSRSFRAGIDGSHKGIRLNDVASLPDGRILVSLHAKDQSVFVGRDGAVRTDWSVGELMNHEVLYHQHDLEYVSAAGGGPAVLVADSGNDRVVEFQRRDGDWAESWEWATGRMDDPRDVERLPDGATLIANTGGDEVIVVSPSGSVEWAVDVVNPVDAERLGPEGSPESAVSLGLESSREPDPLWDAPFDQYLAVGLTWIGLDGVVDWLLPYWLQQRDLPAVFALAGAVVGWLLTELWWRRRRLVGATPD
jgi:hypothetical protein